MHEKVVDVIIAGRDQRGDQHTNDEVIKDELDGEGRLASCSSSKDDYLVFDAHVVVVSVGGGCWLLLRL